MKKSLLLLTAVFALLGFGNAVAENTIIKKSLPLSEAEKTWGADFITVDGNSFTYNAGQNEDGGDNWGNGAMGWTTVTDISSYTNLVLKLEEATTSTIEIVVANGGFWGMDNNYSKVMEQGETEISLPIASMTKNGSATADGSALDLTAINLIFLRTGWVHEQTIKIKDFYLEKVITDTDAKDYEEIDVTGGSAHSGSPTAVVSVVTFANGGDEWGYNVSNINTSLYKYLVVVPKVPYAEGATQYLYGLTDGTNSICDWGFAYGFFQQRRASVINLNDKTLYATKEQTETTKSFADNDIDMTSLKNFFIRAEGTGDYNLSALYFTNESPTYDNRWNFPIANADYTIMTEAANSYGTICLPYAAAICGAKAYQVAGAGTNKLYLKEVNGVLKAGAAYIYITTSDKVGDFQEGYVTFYRAGANTVATPDAEGTLNGTFSETANVPASSFVLAADGKWSKGGTITANQAYLTLDGVGTPSDSEIADCLVMDIDYDVATGINSVKAENSNGNDAIYNLNGIRTIKANKGLYIKNGKKIVVR